jgi:hypothetical protein
MEMTPRLIAIRASGDESGVSDYRREGGERPRELLAKEPRSYNLARLGISAIAKLTAAKGLGMIPTARCAPELDVAARTWGALAAIRHAFRLPEAASTATVSGCRSSVREMTGNRRARTQTMATASILVLCLGFRRDVVQRNRQSQIAATVTASQTRLRKVSISPAYAICGKCRGSHHPGREIRFGGTPCSLQRCAIQRQTFPLWICTVVLVRPTRR